MANPNVLHGLHMPVQGFTERARAAANFLGGCFVWRPAEGPQDAANFQDAPHLVLLDTPQVGEQPMAYLMRTRERIAQWLNSPVWRDTARPMVPTFPVFILGNEPNQRAYDVSTPWDLGEWQVQAQDYARAIRSQYPGIVLAAAAFRPEDAHETTPAYFEQFDVATAHCYWQIASDVQNENLGQAWRHVADACNGATLYITEVNSVALNGPSPTGEYERGTRPEEIAAWVATLDERVEGYMLFIADGEGSRTDTDLNWAQFDVSPDDARAVMLAGNAPLPPPPPEPPPEPPAPPPEPLAYNGDYQRFWPMTLEQYYGAVDAYSAGKVSPMRSEAAYQTLIEVARGPAQPFDPRLFLAFAAAEGNMGVFGAAIAHGNYLGIKWVQQPWGYDTEVPADTGGTYCGYTTLGNLARDWVRIMHNSIIGPDYEAGNLTGVVEHYTNGPGTGTEKITIYAALGASFPPSAADPNAQGPIVTRADFLAMVKSQDGQIRSGAFDTRNGDHYWCNPATGDYWCLSLMERSAEHLGLTINPQPSAYAAGVAMRAAGKLRTDVPPPVGSCIVLDETFWQAGGHIGVCDEDGGAGMTCTCTPEGVGHRPWGVNTAGYMGWFDYDGIGERKDGTDMRIDGMNDPGTFERQWHGPQWDSAAGKPAEGAFSYHPEYGIEGLWHAEYMAGRPLGYATSEEEGDAATPGRVVRYFSNGHITWDNNLQRGWVN